MNLNRWIQTREPQQRAATKADVLPLFNSFQRLRKLEGIKNKYTNVKVFYIDREPKDIEEWALILDVREKKDDFVIFALALGTADKYKAVRRAHGWGYVDKDGRVKAPILELEKF